MTDVIVHSDNVGMTFIGQKLGADPLFDYLDKFGIGKPTGIDLQGEASPRLREKGTWNIVDLATASFGQGIAVTPIQVVRAVSAIANDGVLVTPRVVATTKAPQSQRVISVESADQITAMMAEAASRGEAQWTNLKGFKVAGKTGTAQIPIAGHYDEEKTNASFIGFAPYDKPKFVMLVTIREPESSPWASETAAPLWYSIAKDIFPYLGIQPEK
jgi:cell division protein FtsI/penicillin-binding protein 2